MFSQTSSAEPSNSCKSFTISQVEPGALLHFDPPLHSKELAEAIHNYIPGPFTLQEKQRQVSMEFYQWRSNTCPEGPASYFHDAASAIEFSSFSSAEASFDLPTSGETSFGNNTAKSAPVKKTKSKVVKKSSAKPASSGSRLPGFSIMTKDGVDITDLAPRGPKTKEQREHAAMMRKLSACPTCKKRKQRCNPSHHAQVSPSASSAKVSSPTSSAMESQAPTPTSSAASGNSPFQRYSQEVQISQTGQHFNTSILSPKIALSPSDFSLAFALDSAAGLDLGMDIFDPILFDSSMLFSGFEPDSDEFLDDSIFDFNNWDMNQSGSDLLATNVSSHHSNSAVLAGSSQGSIHSPITPVVLTGGHFHDFVPAWNSGSTPLVPVNGSSLPLPEEFGFQADFSRNTSRNNLVGDRSLIDSVQQQPDVQHASLFGEYSPSSFSSSEMMTPTTMSASSSSQGISSDPTVDQGSVESRSSVSNVHLPMTNSSTSVESNSGPEFDILDNFDFDAFLSEGVSDNNEPFEFDIDAGIESEQRMTPVIQSSWGSRPEQQVVSRELNAVLATTAPLHGDKTKFTPISPDTMKDYQIQLMLLEQQNKKRCMMARQDTVEMNSQPTSSAVIPGDQPIHSSDVIPSLPGRPFRSSPVDRHGEDSSLVDGSVNSRPIVLGEESAGSSIRQSGAAANGLPEGIPHGRVVEEAGTRMYHNRQGLDSEPARQAVNTPVSRISGPSDLFHRTAVREEVRLRSSGHSMPASTVHQDNTNVSSPVHSSPSENTAVVVRPPKPLWQRLLDQGVLSQDSTLEGVLQNRSPRDTRIEGILALVVIGGLCLLLPSLRLQLLDVLICIMIPSFLYRISGNMRKDAKNFGVPKCLASALSCSAPPTTRNRPGTLQWLNSVAPQQCLI